MSKIATFSLAILLMLNAVMPAPQLFAKYRRIEAYEVRPGILLIPRYASNGGVCEIGIQKLNYSPEMIRLGSGFDEKEIDEVLDELAPTPERGKHTKGPEDGLIRGGGFGQVVSMDFENILIKYYSAQADSKKKGRTAKIEMVVTVKWKNHRCQ